MSDESQDPSQPLDNYQHEKFSQLVAGGIVASEAYRQVMPDCTEESSWTGAWKWLRKIEGKKSDISARIEWIQGQSLTGTVLSLKEKRDFMARNTRIKLHALDLETDGDLVQEIEYHNGENGGGIKRIKLPGKRECIMDDAKLAGELTEKTEVVQKGDPNAPLVVQLPKICYTPRKKKET